MPPAPPPFISTSDPGSYAQHTVVDRQPQIIAEVMETNTVSPSARSALEALDREIREGVVTSPLGTSLIPPGVLEEPELRTWEEQIGRHEGRKYLDLPWYFSESFFYLKLLASFGYYNGAGGPTLEGGGAALEAGGSTLEGGGPTLEGGGAALEAGGSTLGRGGAIMGDGGSRPVAHGRRDPFLAQKERELMDPHGGLAMARQVLESSAAMGRAEALAFHLHCALWGNRLDLSTFVVDESVRKNVLTGEAGMLLVDHTAEAAAALLASRRIGVILDNAGPELVCDLLLADLLLSGGGRRGAAGPPVIVLHVKKAPFFVSDATVADTHQTIRAMAGDADARVSAAGVRLGEALRSGRLVVKDHWFWNSALHFTAFPPDLAGELGSCDLLVLKGDANYRRTLEDRKWETSLSLDELAGYFPAPFVSLRTLKSELVVDVPKAEAKKLSHADPGWMVNGKRGLIRYCRLRP